MTTSMLLLVASLLAAEPEKASLPTRMLNLPADTAHVRLDGKRMFISGFHACKLATLSTSGKKPKELTFDAYEQTRIDSNGGEYRALGPAAGGDLVLANGKIFVLQVFQGSLLVVDQATLKPIKRLPIGAHGCLTASKDGKTVYFASNLKEEFHIIDTTTYAIRTVAYPPGGRGCLCVALAPDEKRLFLGIQRGGKVPDGAQPRGGNCFLAAYDLAKNRWAGTVFLAKKPADGSEAVAIPTSLAFTPDGQRLYVGMFQSPAGIAVVDPHQLKLLERVAFASNRRNSGFPWTDPLSVAVFDRWLLVAVRHNQEVAVVDRATHKVVANLTHGAAVDVEQVLVQEGRIYVFGGSSAISIVRGKDLAKLLVDSERKKTGSVRVTLTKK